MQSPKKIYQEKVIKLRLVDHIFLEDYTFLQLNKGNHMEEIIRRMMDYSKDIQVSSDQTCTTSLSLVYTF